MAPASWCASDLSQPDDIFIQFDVWVTLLWVATDFGLLAQAAGFPMLEHPQAGFRQVFRSQRGADINGRLVESFLGQFKRAPMDANGL